MTTLLPTPHPPVWIDLTVSERRRETLAAAEHARRLKQLRPARRIGPAIAPSLVQAVGAALIRFGTWLQPTGAPRGGFDSVGTTREATAQHP